MIEHNFVHLVSEQRCTACCCAYYNLCAHPVAQEVTFENVNDQSTAQLAFISNVKAPANEESFLRKQFREIRNVSNF